MSLAGVSFGIAVIAIRRAVTTMVSRLVAACSPCGVDCAHAVPPVPSTTQPPNRARRSPTTRFRCVTFITPSQEA